LQEFSSVTGIPVFNPTWHIKMHDLTHNFNMGLADIHQNPASRLIFQESDLVLILGCPLDFTLDFGEAPLLNNNTKLITVNSSARELADNHVADVKILSHVNFFNLG
jgi:acetolactate synthase-1/2/3 large subunit